MVHMDSILDRMHRRQNYRKNGTQRFVSSKATEEWRFSLKLMKP